MWDLAILALAANVTGNTLQSTLQENIISTCEWKKSEFSIILTREAGFKWRWHRQAAVYIYAKISPSLSKSQESKVMSPEKRTYKKINLLVLWIDTGFIKSELIQIDKLFFFKSSPCINNGFYANGTGTPPYLS